MLRSWNGFREEAGHPHVRARLFQDLLPEQQAVVDVLKQQGRTGHRHLCLASGIPQGQTAGILLLNLEFQRAGEGLPGKGVHARLATVGFVENATRASPRQWCPVQTLPTQHQSNIHA